MDQKNPIVKGNVFVEQGRIKGIGNESPSVDTVIDARGCVVIPGFVQTHIHLCQTIFRGSADDLALIDWLKQRVWPMEAAHTPQSIRASAQLGVAELIKGGTTCALTMETVNHTDEVFRVVEESGFRATIGKCMMDKGEDLPAGLFEQTENSIRESIDLLDSWHGKGDGRIRYCLAPRFAVSCTKELLTRVARLARERGVMVHTHASENLTECQMVETETGMRNISYLDSVGISGRHVALAHCVHVDEAEIELLARTQTNVVHCPSSNLKLGSGIAPVKRMIDQNVSVSLGADGAACNNRLDMFTEMRTATLLQKALHGPEAIPAELALRLATIDGARALGLEREIGSLEIGKRADVTVVNLQRLHCVPSEYDPLSALVYSAGPADVQAVLIDGKVLLKDGELLTLKEQSVVENVRQEIGPLLKRAGVSVAV